MLGLIVAKSKNNVIGKDNDIPWDIPGEQTQFKELTTYNTVIMGRKTFESLGSNPLKNRENIVITRSGNYDGENLKTARSLAEAISIAQSENIYIIGGASLYEEAIPLVDIMYITEINLVVEGDKVVCFPRFSEENYKKEITEKTPDFIRYVYTRKSD